MARDTHRGVDLPDRCVCGGRHSAARVVLQLRTRVDRESLTDEENAISDARNCETVRLVSPTACTQLDRWERWCVTPRQGKPDSSCATKHDSDESSGTRPDLRFSLFQSNRRYRDGTRSGSSTSWRERPEEICTVYILCVHCMFAYVLAIRFACCKNESGDGPRMIYRYRATGAVAYRAFWLCKWGARSGGSAMQCKVQ